MSDSDNGENKDGNDNSGDEGSSILDNGGIDTDERAGRSLGIEPDKEPDDETKEEMEEVRQERLDPDNRPEGAEIDNSDRTFDATRGQFTDSEDYDDSEPAPFADAENPNTDEEVSDASDETDDTSDDSDDSAKSDDSDDSDDDSGDSGDSDDEDESDDKAS